MGGILWSPYMPMDSAALFLAALVAFNVAFELLTEKLEHYFGVRLRSTACAQLGS